MRESRLQHTAIHCNVAPMRVALQVIHYFWKSRLQLSEFCSERIIDIEGIIENKVCNHYTQQFNTHKNHLQKSSGKSIPCESWGAHYKTRCTHAFVRAYVCVCVCVVCMNVYTYICTSIKALCQVLKCMYMCVCIWMCESVYLCARVCASACGYECYFSCVWV